MRIFTYFKELQNRMIIVISFLILNFILLNLYREQVLYLLSQSQENNFPYFIATNLTETFAAYIELSFFLACYFLYPLILIQIWFFLLPGLYEYECEVFKKVVYLCIFLFLFSTKIIYSFFLPYCWKFFTSFELKADNSIVGVYLETRLGEYLNFVMKITVLCNFLFLCVLIFTALLSYVKIKSLVRYRKIIYLTNFIIATIFSPPDIISQLVIACFLVVLVELIKFSIFLSYQYYILRANNGI